VTVAPPLLAGGAKDTTAFPVAPLTEAVATTEVGAAGLVTVVNVHTKAVASALPAVSVTPEVIVATYCVSTARLAVGVNVAVFPLTLIVPPTGPPPPATSEKVALFSADGLIGSENVADTAAFRATPVAPFAGETETKVGGVVSGAPLLPPPPPPPQPYNSAASRTTKTVRKFVDQCTCTSTPLQFRPRRRIGARWDSRLNLQCTFVQGKLGSSGT